MRRFRIEASLRHPARTCRGDSRSRTRASPHCSPGFPPSRLTTVRRAPTNLANPRGRRHRDAHPHAGARHPCRRLGDRSPDHRAARLHLADRRARPRSPASASASPAAGRQRQRVRPRHQLQPGAGAARRHAAERRLRLVRRVQLRRRHARRRRAHRGHPRPDGGAVRLRRDRRRDQPDLAPGATSQASTSPANLPAAIRRRSRAT